LYTFTVDRLIVEDGALVMSNARDRVEMRIDRIGLTASLTADEGRLDVRAYSGDQPVRLRATAKSLLAGFERSNVPVDFAECKAMIDREHDLPITRLCRPRCRKSTSRSCEGSTVPGPRATTIGIIEARRDHVELPDGAAELPFACRGGLLARRFRCSRYDLDHTGDRQKPESGSEHTETYCKKLHRYMRQRKSSASNYRTLRLTVLAIFSAPPAVYLFTTRWPPQGRNSKEPQYRLAHPTTLLFPRK
jgi:hypothetical protein